MADDKEKPSKKVVRDKKAKKKLKKRGLGFKEQFLLIIIVLFAVAFLKTTMVLIVGMFPTITILLLERKTSSSKAATVGSMNFAGCSPYLLDIWLLGHDFDDALQIISDPRIIIVMYGAALAGYTIHWFVSNLVEAFLIKQSKFKLNEIGKELEALKERWGVEVTGEIAVDEYGFPVAENMQET